MNDREDEGMSKDNQADIRTDETTPTTTGMVVWRGGKYIDVSEDVSRKRSVTEHEAEQRPSKR